MTLTGENTFALNAAERQLIDAFVKKHGQNGVERVDAESLNLARLPDLLQGVTLFAPARLVVMKHLGANKAVLEPLAEALRHAASETTVVIAEPALDKRTKLFKFLKANSTFKEFAPLDEKQLAAWAQAEATRLGGELGLPEARHLAARVGGDQWRLSLELDKLVSYKPTITIAAVDDLVEPSPEGSAFDLLDAAIAGKPGEIAERIAALKLGEDPYKLFGLLASQVYGLAVLAHAGQRAPDAIAKDTGLHPFVLRKMQPVARQLGPGRVAHIAEAVAQCDWQLKSVNADPWDLLQWCLQKIAS